MPILPKAAQTARTPDPRRGSAPGRPHPAGPGGRGPAWRPASPGALPLSPALRAQQCKLLAQRLNGLATGDELRLTITNNRSVMITAKRNERRGITYLRLHHLFIEAPDEVLADLLRYITAKDPEASRRLGDFIEERQDRILPGGRGPAPAAITPRGKVYDLTPIFDQLNGKYFGGALTCSITWGRNVGRGKERRSIKLGSYEVEGNLIRIHPGLDQDWIPELYLQWVVFHEMLHAACPVPPVVNGRRRFHTATFSDEERRFHRFEEAAAWEKRNIAALLSI